MSYTHIRGKWYDKDNNEIKIELNKENGKTYVKGEYEVVPVDALDFKSAAQCAEEPPKEWLIEGVIALNEDSSWWGPSGGLKSTLLAEIGLSVAAGRDWRGHKFNRNDLPNRDPDANINEDEFRGVVIFATERAALTRRRIAAYIKRENLPPDIPIAVSAATVNFMDPNCVNQISDTILKVEQDYECFVGLTIFDTWSKCLGGHDEMLAHVQNYAAEQIKKIRDRHHGCFHVASVGHSGKSIEAGERGSSARRAHVDFAVKIYGEGKVKTAKVDKANDGEEGIILATFHAEEIITKKDDQTETLRNGKEHVFTYDPVTVSILAPYSAATPASAACPDVSKALTGKQTQDIEALQLAITGKHGQDGGVHPDFWKEELTKAGRIKSDDVNPRATFNRIRKNLSQHIIEVDGLIRLKSQPGKIPPCPVA